MNILKKKWQDIQWRSRDQGVKCPYLILTTGRLVIAREEIQYIYIVLLLYLPRGACCWASLTLLLLSTAVADTVGSTPTANKASIISFFCKHHHRRHVQRENVYIRIQNLLLLLYYCRRTNFEVNFSSCCSK
jgi:hypothetical protein